MDTLQTLVAELLIALQLYFPAMTEDAKQPPRIEALNASDLQHRVCGAPCQVWAWYSKDRVVYIDARLDPTQNLFARSIIVHEIVHHIQHGEHGPARDCEDWIGRERQAFAVQASWLKSQGIKPPSFAQRVNSMACVDRTPLANPNAGLGG